LTAKGEEEFIKVQISIAIGVKGIEDGRYVLIRDAYFELAARLSELLDAESP